jgi:hypothetical protein
MLNVIDVEGPRIEIEVDICLLIHRSGELLGILYTVDIISLVNKILFAARIYRIDYIIYNLYYFHLKIIIRKKYTIINYEIIHCFNNLNPNSVITGC